MVAKGLDLPLVTLVGVISADTGLNLPDFRAAERTFQVLTQVAGRAGRSPLGGEVVLQTYHPEHYAIEAAANHDYQMFFNQELEHRKSLGYPPFVRLAKLVYRHTDSRTTEAETKRLAGLLRQRIQKAGTKADLIGPVPCYFQQVRGEYRWQIVLRSSRPHALIPDQLGRGWSVDIDPVSLL
jgi:primosomal protein N' (replication factor Y)